MSKLDNIVMNALAFNNLDGWLEEDVVEEKQKIKDLMLELAESAYLNNQSAKSAVWLDEFRQKVNEL